MVQAVDEITRAWGGRVYRAWSQVKCRPISHLQGPGVGKLGNTVAGAGRSWGARPREEEGAQALPSAISALEMMHAASLSGKGA